MPSKPPHLAASAFVSLMLAGCGAGSDLAAVHGGPPAAKLLGDWRENFESRPGCSDTATIFDEGGTLRVRGKDCEKHVTYVFGDITYDGKVLVLPLDIPTSGYHVRYTFRWLTDNDLAGDAVVSTAAGPKTYHVRWTRIPAAR